MFASCGWGFLPEWICTIWTNTIAFFWWWVEMIVCAVKKGACAWLNWVFDTGLVVWDAALDTFPAPPVLDDWPVEDFAGALVIWFPVSWCVAMWASYGVWKVAFLAYRTIKRHVPTVA